MKSVLGSVLAFCLFIALLPQMAYAANLTLNVPAEVTHGAQLTLSGTVPGSEAIITIKNGDGEILYFDTQKVVSGSYSTVITVPAAWQAGTYRVTAISGGAEIVKDVNVRQPAPSTGSTGPVSPGPGAPEISAAPGGVNVVMKPVLTDGKWTAVLQANQLKQALELMKAGANGQSSRLSLRLDAEGGNAAGESILQLPSEAAALLWNSTATELVIDTPQGSMTFDRQSLQAMQSKGSGDVRFSTATVDPGSLASGARLLVDGRPVVDFSAQVGNERVSHFGGGTVKLGFTYKAGAGVDPNAIIVYYIPEQGEPLVVPSGVYDADAGLLSVAVKHFSVYGVGVNKVSFADVTGWSTDYITYLAARGIVDGVGEGRFAPAKSITRAEFVTIIARMSEGEEASGYTNGLFMDVQAGDWYAPYVQWGYENGVVNGTGAGKFSPDSPITREQMAVMLSRYAEFAGYTLPELKASLNFADSASFSSWASQAIGELQQAGIIDGVGGNRFNPQGIAKREEAAKMISVLLQGMSR